MRKYIEVERKRVERQLSFVKCDLCGRSTNDPENWCNEHFGVNEVTIERRKGDAYSDGGSYEKTAFDVCPDCFKSKLLPWLKSKGAEPTITQVDY